MDWIEKLARAHGTGGWQSLDDMIRFGEAIANAAATEEREACALVCDKNSCDYTREGAEVCAKEIRARSGS